MAIIIISHLASAPSYFYIDKTLTWLKNTNWPRNVFHSSRQQTLLNALFYTQPALTWLKISENRNHHNSRYEYMYILCTHTPLKYTLGYISLDKKANTTKIGIYLYVTCTFMTHIWNLLNYQ